MKFAHKLTLALLVVLTVVLSLCNTVLIGQQFRQELHTAQETLSADWQRESRAMQRTLVTPTSGSLAARVGSYLQAITEQNSLACAAYSVDGTSLYYALPTAVPLSEVEALLAQDGEPRMVLANNHTLLCAGTVVLPERITEIPEGAFLNTGITGVDWSHITVIGKSAVSYTHLTLPTTPYV